MSLCLICVAVASLKRYSVNGAVELDIHVLAMHYGQFLISKTSSTRGTKTYFTGIYLGTRTRP